jgi:hypothetical protein
MKIFYIFFQVDAFLLKGGYLPISLAKTRMIKPTITTLSHYTTQPWRGECLIMTSTTSLFKVPQQILIVPLVTLVIVVFAAK